MKSFKGRNWRTHGTSDEKKLPKGFSAYDSVDYLKIEADILAYLDACFAETGDHPTFVTQALGNVARARGMTKLARKTGLTREGLYTALSGKGNPEFATIWKLMNALGVQLRPV